MSLADEEVRDSGKPSSFASTFLRPESLARGKEPRDASDVTPIKGAEVSRPVVNKDRQQAR